MALGGGFRGASLSEESGSCRRPGYSLVEVTWSTVGAEGAGPRGGCTTTYQGGGRPRPSLHGGVGRRRVLQFMAGASGISPYLRVSDGSFSLGVHRQPEPASFTVVASDMLYIYI